MRQLALEMPFAITGAVWDGGSSALRLRRLKRWIIWQDELRAMGLCHCFLSYPSFLSIFFKLNSLAIALFYTGASCLNLGRRECMKVLQNHSIGIIASPITRWLRYRRRFPTKQLFRNSLHSIIAGFCSAKAFISNKN